MIRVSGLMCSRRLAQALERDDEHMQHLRSLRQEYDKMRVQYDERIKHLQTSLKERSDEARYERRWR